jgi:hypothetical protein
MDGLENIQEFNVLYQRVSNIALTHAKHKATSPTRKPNVTTNARKTDDTARQ